MKHKVDCKMSFGRKDETCPRCQELLQGASARSWTGSRRRYQDLQQIAAIRTHDCKASGCGPVCTFGDW